MLNIKRKRFMLSVHWNMCILKYIDTDLYYLYTRIGVCLNINTDTHGFMLSVWICWNDEKNFTFRSTFCWGWSYNTSHLRSCSPFFPTMFSMQSVSKNPFLIVTFQLWSAASLNVGWSQNLVLGNGLTLSQTTDFKIFQTETVCRRQF